MDGISSNIDLSKVVFTEESTPVALDSVAVANFEKMIDDIAVEDVASDESEKSDDVIIEGDKDFVSTNVKKTTDEDVASDESDDVVNIEVDEDFVLTNIKKDIDVQVAFAASEESDDEINLEVDEDFVLDNIKKDSDVQVAFAASEESDDVINLEVDEDFVLDNIKKDIDVQVAFAASEESDDVINLEVDEDFVLDNIKKDIDAQVAFDASYDVVNIDKDILLTNMETAVFTDLPFKDITFDKSFDDLIKVEEFDEVFTASNLEEVIGGIEFKERVAEEQTFELTKINIDFPEFDEELALKLLEEHQRVTAAIDANEELGSTESLDELWYAIETTDLENGPTAEEQAIFDRYGLEADDVKELKEDPNITKGAYFAQVAAHSADAYVDANDGSFIVMDIDDNGNLVLYVVTPNGDQAELTGINDGLVHTADWLQNSGSMVLNTGLLNGVSLHFTNEFVEKYGEVGQSPEDKQKNASANDDSDVELMELD